MAGCGMERRNSLTNFANGADREREFLLAGSKRSECADLRGVSEGLGDCGLLVAGFWVVVT